MSLVDITFPAAEDQIMDPAIKQYVDTSLAVAEARSATKSAEFRATMEACTARAEEREAQHGIAKSSALRTGSAA